MNRQRVLGFCIGIGIMACAVGVDQCATGYTYAAAAKHEATAIGKITRVGHGKGGPYYHYAFSANGAKLDDYSDVCSTPLSPDACWNNGPLLVYYSYEPFPNSRLEDFKIASMHSYRIGVPWLIISAFLFAIGSAVSTFSRRDRGDSESKEESDENDPDNVEESIHVIPKA